jgi:hypothetical protein
MLKLTVAEDSLAEYRDTGTETSPNEMVAVPIERGGICPIYAANQEPARIPLENAAELIMAHLFAIESGSPVSQPCLMHPAISLLTFRHAP